MFIWAYQQRCILKREGGSQEGADVNNEILRVFPAPLGNHLTRGEARQQVIRCQVSSPENGGFWSSENRSPECLKFD